MITVESHALELDGARRQPQVTSLVRLVAIEKPAGDPLSVGVERPFPHVVDSGERRPLADRTKRHDDSLPGHEIILRPRLDDHPAMLGDVLAGPRSLRVP